MGSVGQEHHIEAGYTWVPCSAPPLWVCRRRHLWCRHPAPGPPPCPPPCWGHAVRRPPTAKPAKIDQEFAFRDEVLRSSTQDLHDGRHA